MNMTQPKTVLKKRCNPLLLAGILTAALLAGCGGNTACHTCVIVSESGTDGPSFVVGSGGASGLNIVGGIHLTVMSGAGVNALPVPGAEITLWSGGSFGTVTMYEDTAQSILAGNGTVWQTQVDENGSLRVYVSAAVASCTALGFTTDQNGSFGITAATANDDLSYVSAVSLKCTP